MTSKKNDRLTYDNIFAAQRPIAAAEGQELIRNTRVFIGGSGGLGFNIAVAAARAGFQHIAQADPQEVEIDNLNRILAGPEHISMKKVDVLDRLFSSFERTREQGFDYCSHPYPLESKLAAHHIMNCDLFFSCANNSDSRLYLLERAIKHQKLLLNVGVSCNPPDVFIGEISLYMPGNSELACPACISLKAGQSAGASPLFFPVLQVLSGLAVTIAVAHLTNFDHARHVRPNFFQYSVYDHKVDSFVVERDPACAYCAPLREVI
jgi:molybdopterin/thiamine biosynthesis adenylyltransferase